jgi:hypothetical protein
LKPAFQTAASERAEMERVNRELGFLLEDAIKKKKRKASGDNSKPAFPTGITEADLEKAGCSAGILKSASRSASGEISSKNGTKFSSTIN